MIFKKAYRVAPPVSGNQNAAKEDQVSMVIEGFTMTDKDDLSRAAATLANTYEDEKARDLYEQKLRKLIASKVRDIKGIFVEDENGSVKELTTYDELYTEGPSELAAWVLNAVYSTEILAGAEVKN